MTFTSEATTLAVGDTSDRTDVYLHELAVSSAPPPPPPPPPPPTDTVSITLADHDTAKRVLRVEATSTNRTAILTVHVTSTGERIGTLTGDGSGRYRGELSWPTNPGEITVKSSAGGPATRTVTAK